MFDCRRGLQTAMAAAAVLIALAAPSRADNIDATDPEKLVNLVRGFGSGTLEKGSDGDPLIRGRIGGTAYAIFFFGCTEGKDCKSVNFYAGWDKSGITVEKINEWNKSKRFTRAYLDKDNEPVIEMDVNMMGGLSTVNFEDDIDWWRILMEKFEKEVVNGTP